MSKALIPGKYNYIPYRKRKAGEPGLWPPAKKTEVLMTWLATGNVPQTSAITGVPLDTIAKWKMKPWWKEQVQAFYDDDKVELDAKYQKIVRKALSVMDDRLTNGNFQLDQKTGRIVRVPVNIGDAHRVMKDLVDQQQVLRQDQVKMVSEQKESVNDKLVKLAEHFAEMALGKKKEKVVGETYENGFTADKTPLEVSEVQPT